jgi:uncharacterized protein YxeA
MMIILVIAMIILITAIIGIHCENYWHNKKMKLEIKNYYLQRDKRYREEVARRYS